MSAPQMSPQSSAKAQPAVSGSDAAPIIYCDGIVAAGMLGGVVQLELAANCLIPTDLNNDKPPRNRVLITGHIRLSAQAAMALRTAIDNLLRVPEKPAVAIKTADPRLKPGAKPVPAKSKPKAPAMPAIERHEMTRAPAPSEMVNGE